jgi:4-hydroxythreonine-4-phosphate dehydrogenase
MMRKAVARKPIIGITMGDPAGIGPEVAVKAVIKKDVKKLCYPLAFGSHQVLLKASKKFSKGTPVRRILRIEQVMDSGDRIDVMHCTDLDPGKVRIGRINRISGKMAADSLFCATQFALSNQIDAMVTAPLSKKGLRLAGYDFPGHTELLAYLTATRRYAMMFVSDKRKVVLVTTHLPLSHVAPAISRKVISDKLIVTCEALRQYFGVDKPKIGVCALNPHGGEEGILGAEEVKIILPAIKAARKKGIKASGPFPGDTIFSPTVAKDFDCILAMYHDQGLIPLKTVGLGRSVNVTIGLPIIRTSPDFGTALDIAGKGVADAAGMIRAILLACRMAQRRTGRRTGRSKSLYIDLKSRHRQPI